jgi:hypothetical protein
MEEPAGPEVGQARRRAQEKDFLAPRSPLIRNLVPPRILLYSTQPPPNGNAAFVS